MDIIIEIPEQIAELLQADSPLNKIDRLKKHLGLTTYVAKFYSKLWNSQKSNGKPSVESLPDTSTEDTKINQVFDKNKASLEINSLTISTIEDALEVAEVDLDVWEVDRAIVNSWQVTMKVKNEQGLETPIQRTNYQIKVKLKTKVVDSIQETLTEFVNNLPLNPITYPTLPKITPGNILLECGLVDHHFGMLAWGKETLSDYDLEIAETLYVQSVKKAIERIGDPSKIGKILIPIGHDFFHINDSTNQTPRAKHQLDVDGRLPKVYSTGKIAAIRAIEYCLSIAPVEIVYVPGNHDPQLSYFLCDTIDSWFKDCPDVTVDKVLDNMINPTSRKYRKWGKGLLGMSHGLDEKIQDLPLIMANEVPDLWASTTYKEIHIGHYHKSKSNWFTGGDTFNPVIVRTLPSLSGSDNYSYSHGWLSKGVQLAEFYLWDKDYGHIGHYSIKAEEILG